MNSKYKQLKFEPISQKLSDIKKCGIYVIKNIKNNKVYVGKTLKRFSIRLAQHSASLCNNKSVNSHLQNSFNKYGYDSFIFYIREYVNDKNKIDTQEKYWISYYRNKLGDINVYNYNDGGNGDNWNNEAKEKLSNSLKKYYKNNPEEKKKISIRMKQMYIDKPYMKENLSNKMKHIWKEKDNTLRIKHIKESLNSEILKEKLSLAGKKNWQNDVYRNKVTLKVKEKRSTKEQKTITSITTKERWKNDEYRNKMIKIQRDRCKDKNYIQKLSISVKKSNTPELRKLKSENGKKRYSNIENRILTGIKSKEAWKRQSTKENHKNSLLKYSKRRKQENTMIEYALSIVYVYMPKLQKMGITKKRKFFTKLVMYINELNLTKLDLTNLKMIVTNYPDLLDI